MIALLILLIYILGAAFTYIWLYIKAIKEYKLEEYKTITFSYWYNTYESVDTIIKSVFWFIFLPFELIACFFNIISKIIRKKYNVE